MPHKHTRRRSLGLWVIVCSSAVGSLWASSALLGTKARVRAKEAKEQAGGHGALAMDKQQEKLKALAPESAVQSPKGISPAFFALLVPKDNPGTATQVELGRKLYFDTRLSRDGSVACATCHDVSRGFTDQRSTSEGIGDQVGRRNSPTTLNALFFQTQFLDGRAITLEDQAKLPITNPIEMGLPNGEAAVLAIRSDAAYQELFQKAYGRPVNFDDLARAIAAFERTLVFLDAPFDRFLSGQVDAISADARAGWALFLGKGRCSSCHQLSALSPIGTDNRFHNIGVAARHQDFEGLARKALETLAKDDSKERMDELALQTDLSELGRFVVTRNRSDIGAFKTSQLRNAGITPPYMHDGSLVTLWDVMDHYNKGGEPNPFLDGGMEPLALSEKEIDQLVAFMFTLTDDKFKQQNEGQEARQRTMAKGRRPIRDEALALRRVFPFERRVVGKPAP